MKEFGQDEARVRAFPLWCCERQNLQVFNLNQQEREHRTGQLESQYNHDQSFKGLVVPEES
jgi:hypothetical protein